MPLSTVIARGHAALSAAWSSAWPTHLPVSRKLGLQRHALATPLIDHREDAELASVVHLVVDEVHAPVLVRSRGRRDLAAQQAMRLRRLTFMRSCSPSRRYSRYTRFLPTAQPSRLSMTKHAQVAESWSAHGDLADALPQRALIARLALGVPHRSSQQRQSA